MRFPEGINSIAIVSCSEQYSVLFDEARVDGISILSSYIVVSAMCGYFRAKELVVQI